MQYFDHDTTAGSDDKIIALRLECGGAAVDAYWTILEQIYRDETELVLFGNRLGLRSLSHRLATDEKTLETWLSTMFEIDLLQRSVDNPNAVTSERAMRNIAAYQEKRETARQNGKKGGRKPTQKPNPNQDTNQTLTDAETKRKANKRKEKKDIGLHKVNQISVTPEPVAAAAKAAPNSAKLVPHCPSCGVKAFRNTQTGKYDCPNCFDSWQAEAVVWR